MCITFLYTNPTDTSRYRLVLVNNRDEFFARITLKAELRETASHLRTIHGTDIEAIEHGTWLGLSQKADTVRIGNLLNVTGESVRHGGKGRGGLVIDFIEDEMSGIEEHNKRVVEKGGDFNGFNLLTVEMRGDSMKVFNVCNVDRSVEKVPFGEFLVVCLVSFLWCIW
jgi:uncharacterized protein with NRDE domain